MPAPVGVLCTVVDVFCCFFFLFCPNIHCAWCCELISLVNYFDFETCCVFCLRRVTDCRRGLPTWGVSFLLLQFCECRGRPRLVRTHEQEHGGEHCALFGGYIGLFPCLPLPGATVTAVSDGPTCRQGRRGKAETFVSCTRHLWLSRARLARCFPAFFVGGCGS